MIISHQHKFIFVKTRKTASTSVELAISAFCDENDIVTRFPEDDEKLRARMGLQEAVNYKVPWRELSPRQWGGVLLRRKQRPTRYAEHIDAGSIRDLVGNAVWNSYFTFSIERNPWDKALSAYYYRRAHTHDGLSFREYLERDDQDFSYTNFPLYSIEGEIGVDFVIRYEALDEDLAEVGRRIGLPAPLVTPPVRAKSHFRKDRRPYTEVIGDVERELISRRCEREIAAFGYSFDVS